MMPVPEVVSLSVLLVIVGLIHKCSSATDPLLLTPLLLDNKVSEAQTRSRIQPDILKTACFSGYFTVNRECKSNLFFWFCQAQNDWENSSVLLWLQGGPASPSLFGLLTEIGPFYFVNGSAIENKFSWHKQNNLLFIDQPVGTGFSFTDEGCYAKNKNDIAVDLYFAILQFYMLFPNLKENAFYIAGESYAGHYIPYIAHYIHKKNPTAQLKIKLSGIMIGNGWMDAYYQYDHGEQLYNLGFIDYKTKEYLHQYLSVLRHHMKNKEWNRASKISKMILATVRDLEGHINLFNYVTKQRDLRLYGYPDILEVLRESIHVGSREFRLHNDDVYENLVDKNVYDELQSVKEEIEELLELYPMVFYFGQLDLVCPYSMALPFFRDLSWSGSSGYQEVSGRQWCVDGRLAGIFMSYHNLHVVLVRNAGHLVTVDQPYLAYVLANSVTSSPKDFLNSLIAC